MTFKDIFLLPNLITLTRFFGSLFLFLQFEALDFSVLYLIVIIAIIGLSDSLDGIVARRFNMVSKLGIILDPFTDRVTFLVLIFWLNKILPSMFIYSILVREVLVLFGSLYILVSNKSINVSKKGKLSTVLLFVTICFYVLNLDISVLFINQIATLVVIFYFYVAIEYLYNLIYKHG